MEERNPVLESPNGQVSFVDSNDEEVQSYTAAPIIASGDLIGAVLIF